MYPNNTIHKISRIGILLSLILGFMLISGTMAKAQYIRINPPYQVYNYNNRAEMRREARQNGYRNGFSEGAADARNRNGYHPDVDYRSNYEGGMMRDAYREGYLNGYREGYRRNMRRGFQIRLW